MSVLVVLLHDTLLFDGRYQHIPIQKVLYSCYTVTWVKYLFLHNCLDVLEDVITGVVQECAYNGERHYVLAKILHYSVYRRTLI